jgi:hypothetical protein
MTKLRVIVLASSIGSLAAAGCGNPEGLFPVSGKVLYRGEPAAGAVVYFHSEGGPAVSRDLIPIGITEDDGTFAISCDGVGNGCPPGRYAVLVEWKGKPEAPVAQPKPARGKGRAIRLNRVTRNGVDRLQGRYFDIAKPLLHAEVLPRTNDLPPFELGG